MTIATHTDVLHSDLEAEGIEFNIAVLNDALDTLGLTVTTDPNRESSNAVLTADPRSAAFHRASILIDFLARHGEPVEDLSEFELLDSLACNGLRLGWGTKR